MEAVSVCKLLAVDCSTSGARESEVDLYCVLLYAAVMAQHILVSKYGSCNIMVFMV